MSTVVRPPDVPGPSPPSRRSPRSLLLALVIVVLLVGAGAAVVLTREGSSSPEPSEDVTTQAQPKTEEEKVVEAVKSYFRVDNEALAGPNPDDPRYSAYATGTQLQAAVDATRKVKEQGLAGRHPANSITEQRVTVVSINGDQAQIRVCSIDDGYLVRSDTGKPAYDYPAGFAVTALYSGQMVREDRVWKLSVLRREQRWEGVTGCAAGRA